MINPEIKIRPASLSDSEQLTALVNSVYRGENSKKGWTTEADLLDGIRITKKKIEQLIGTDSNVILIAEFDSKIIGCVHLEKKKNNRCHLGMLSVDVNYQNK